MGQRCMTRSGITEQVTHINMSENYVHVFPKSNDVEELHHYLSWHIKNGRGKYRIEIRQMFPVIPPDGETHDDYERLVILKGVIC